MKRISKIIMVFIICFVLLQISLLGITYVIDRLGLNDYPLNKSDYWYCEEIDMQIYQDWETDGPSPDFARIVWQGKEYVLHIGRLPPGWSGPILHFEEYYKGDNGYITDIVFCGVVRYSGSKFILKLDQAGIDFFNGHYEELVFVPGQGDGLREPS